MDRKKIENIASKLLFKVNDKVLDEIEKEFEELKLKIENLQKINTLGIEPFSRFGSMPVEELREDIPNTTLDTNVLLKNAKNIDKKNNLVIIKKVVKNV